MTYVSVHLRLFKPRILKENSAQLKKIFSSVIPLSYSAYFSAKMLAICVAYNSVDNPKNIIFTLET